MTGFETRLVETGGPKLVTADTPSAFVAEREDRPWSPPLATCMGAAMMGEEVVDLLEAMA